MITIQKNGRKAGREEEELGSPFTDSSPWMNRLSNQSLLFIIYILKTRVNESIFYNEIVQKRNERNLLNCFIKTK
jgi:hypothetical protein